MKWLASPLQKKTNHREPRCLGWQTRARCLLSTSLFLNVVSSEMRSRVL